MLYATKSICVLYPSEGRINDIIVDNVNVEQGVDLLNERGSD